VCYVAQHSWLCGVSSPPSSHALNREMRRDTHTTNVLPVYTGWCRPLPVLSTPSRWIPQECFGKVCNLYIIWEVCVAVCRYVLDWSSVELMGMVLIFGEHIAGLAREYAVSHGGRRETNLWGWDECWVSLLVFLIASVVFVGLGIIVVHTDRGMFCYVNLDPCPCLIVRIVL
jgi:hypothetical protein